MNKGNSKVIICDDDQSILELLGLVAETAGCEVVTLSKSMEVMKAIRQEHPALVVLDLWMPVMSGDMILQTIRKDTALKELPVVIISASRDGRQIAELNGATEYLAKPFDIMDLTAIFQKYCYV
ncbi:response regulator [Niabella hibiscisoli]|uniref:response regulator n=1 Tax=Niabella hibiscisoli TaxID=1825928 RepID=UPI001F10D1E3|nr:response regulator [Niabella hibiscisoli]MCH5719104.1 response regulator [Niabella hibiscisoli]